MRLAKLLKYSNPFLKITAKPDIDIDDNIILTILNDMQEKQCIMRMVLV